MGQSSIQISHTELFRSR